MENRENKGKAIIIHFKKKAFALSFILHQPKSIDIQTLSPETIPLYQTRLLKIVFDLSTQSLKNMRALENGIIR
jgi:hypothetical protein